MVKKEIIEHLRVIEDSLDDIHGLDCNYARTYIEGKYLCESCDCEVPEVKKLLSKIIKELEKEIKDE